MVAAKHVSNFLSALRRLEASEAAEDSDRPSPRAADQMGRVLKALASGEQSVTQLFSITRLDLTTLSDTLNQLESKGLALHRENLYSLTDEGREMAHLMG